ncbi:MAG: hypothetical protein P1P80_08650 [ANME-2 cluster archaeon]|nr:hypothetical protein [ANME-2 cluster archaeon]
MGSIFLDLSYRLFSKGAYAYRDKYTGLHVKLKHARIPLTLEQYISKALFYSILAGLVVEVVGFYLILELMNNIGTPVIDIGDGIIAIWSQTHLDIILAFIFWYLLSI